MQKLSSAIFFLTLFIAAQISTEEVKSLKYLSNNDENDPEENWRNGLIYEQQIKEAMFNPDYQVVDPSELNKDQKSNFKIGKLDKVLAKENSEEPDYHIVIVPTESEEILTE